MDIDLLSKMVKELILDHDEVSLPGVGTFVTEIVPSSFSDKGYTIHPPYRRLYFRQRQNEADTLLSDFYAKSNRIAPETARGILLDFLGEMKSLLLKKRLMPFPGLGRLRATKENNLFFIADEELDIYPEGFGLEPISLKTHQETTEEVAETLDGLKSLMNSEVKEAVEGSGTTGGMDGKVTEERTEKTVGGNGTVTEAEEHGKTDNEEEEKEQVSEAKESEETEGTDGKVTEQGTEKTAGGNGTETDKSGETEGTEENGEKEGTDRPATGTRGRKRAKAAARTLLILVVLALLAFGAFLVLSRTSPELIDKLLYSPEDLELMRLGGGG